MSSPRSDRPSRSKIDPGNVPEPFRSLIPYAQKWGISDDGDLDTAIDEVSTEELKDLITPFRGSEPRGSMNGWGTRATLPTQESGSLLFA